MTAYWRSIVTISLFRTVSDSPCARPNIGTKQVNRFHYDFLCAWYFKCPKMVNGPLHHFPKCHFRGHL